MAFGTTELRSLGSTPRAGLECTPGEEFIAPGLGWATAFAESDLGKNLPVCRPKTSQRRLGCSGGSVERQPDIPQNSITHQNRIVLTGRGVNLTVL